MPWTIPHHECCVFVNSTIALNKLTNIMNVPTSSGKNVMNVPTSSGKNVMNVPTSSGKNVINVPTSSGKNVMNVPTSSGKKAAKELYNKANMNQIC